jgi:Flp pilus assembly protein TadD
VRTSFDPAYHGVGSLALNARILYNVVPITIKVAMKARFLHFGLIALLAWPAAAASAQDADESALDALDTAPKPPPAQVQPPGAAELQDAVRRIAQRPTDSYALTDAGYAAIKLGDYDAAFNFFTKAGALQPADARIKSGLAIAQVRRENPFEALKLFDEALRLGANERNIALDRALAYDLLGNFDRAERDYQMAASFASADEVNLRHAISLSLAGRRDEADRMLVPMLQKNSAEAWRARAMMLASRGDYKEANKIAAGFLPDSEARRMEGYFRNMPRLTAAQQAAAMHFGHFPLGSDIGEDNDAVRTMAAATGAKPVPASGDARLIPSGEPLGAKPATAKADKSKKPKKSDKILPSRSTGIATASAQEAIDAAARAKVTTVPASRLPVPEAARPPVRIALPALARPQAQLPPPAQPQPQAQLPAQARPQPVIGELPATGPAVAPVGGLPPQMGVIEPMRQSPPPAAQTSVVQSPAAQPAVAELPAAQLPVAQPQPAQPEPARFAQIDPTTAIPPEPAPQPGFESLPAAQTGTAVATQPKPDAPVSGPTLDGAPITQVAAATPQAEPVVSQPPPEPVVEKSFDLGVLMASIEVPDEEKKPSTAPVDLKKIKTPTPAAAAAAKTDPNAKTAKAAVSAPRIWVQIATGADANGLGFDYKRVAKKNAALFANREGWTAVWGKTRRLLVGPFPDLKAAKKWETDYRKAGGEGFVWQSDKTAQIEKLKGK